MNGNWKKTARVSLLLLIAMLAALWLADKLTPLNLTKLHDNVLVVNDNNGRPLRAFANEQGIWRYQVNVHQVTPRYLEALLTYEDRHFYQHPGVNPLAMLRAVGQAIYHGKAISGGSTITMQVARLLHPNKRTIGGKITQMLRALQLEWHFNKTQILEMYLNIAPFGGPLEGVQAASFTYFDKPASELTYNEAALLAVLPQSPSRYRPDRYPKRALAARNKLLNRMATYRVWPQQLINTLKQDPIYADYFPHPNTAPLLSRRLKSLTHHSQGRVNTFINGDIQEQLEYQVRDYIRQLPNKASAAVMVMHSVSGEVNAYLGSGDFNDNARLGHVDMIKAVRSPGSTLKPFVYGDAIESGLIHPQSLLHDTPVIKGSYRPTNFSGGYSGPVSASNALLRSLNLPVLQLLNHGASEAMAARLNNAGLNLYWPKYATPNKALVLGGVGVRLENLVSAYAALLNGGQTVTPRYQQTDPITHQFLLTPASAWIVQNILRQQQQPNRLSPQLTQEHSANIGWKTGTSYGNRDAWVIGFSGPYIIGVWIGRADALSVPNNTGNNHALPLFLQAAAHFDEHYLPPRPTNVTKHNICWPSGKLQNQVAKHNCLESKEAWLIDQHAPSTLPSMSPDFSARLSLNYYVEPNGSSANLLCATTKAKPQQLDLWPPAINPWRKNDANQQRIPTISKHCPQMSIGLIPFKITSINPDTSFVRRHKKPIRLTLTTNQHTTVHWFLNGKLLDSSYQVLIKTAGHYQLLALNQQGQVDKIQFHVQ